MRLFTCAVKRRSRLIPSMCRDRRCLPIQIALRCARLGQHHTRVTDNPKGRASQLQILSELRERVTLLVAVGCRPGSRKLPCATSCRTASRMQKASEYLPATQIVLRRDITCSDSDVLGKEQEEALLYRDMQNDAVQQMVRRLQVAKLDLRWPSRKRHAIIRCWCAWVSASFRRGLMRISEPRTTSAASETRARAALHRVRRRAAARA